MKRNRPTGFTLVELSMVLVIVGLLVGGVMAGREMIIHAQLLHIVTDAERVKLAVTTFKNKYGCLPGDCDKVTRFFPGGLCDGASESATAACDGNGDSIIGGSNYTDVNEAFYFWRVLNASGLYRTKLSSSAPCVGFQCSGGYAGQNLPRAAVSNNVPNIMYVANNVTVNAVGTGWDLSRVWIPEDYSNSLVYGAEGYVDTAGGVFFNGWSTNYAFTHLQAQLIDTKIDNGFATTGRVIGGSNAFCFDTAAAGPGIGLTYGNATYGVGGGCPLIFLNLF